MKDFLLDPDLLNELRQEYETILTLLEHEFLGAMITSDWTEFDQFVNDFRAEISTKDLERPGADSNSFDRTNRTTGDNFIMSSTTNYVAQQIDRIERRYAGQDALIIDSKWRIASNTELLYDLNPDGTLTPDQVGHVDQYISWFKSTPEGKEAIAQYARRAA